MDTQLTVVTSNSRDRGRTRLLPEEEVVTGVEAEARPDPTKGRPLSREDPGPSSPKTLDRPSRSMCQIQATNTQ